MCLHLFKQSDVHRGLRAVNYLRTIQQNSYRVLYNGGDDVYVRGAVLNLYGNASHRRGGRAYRGGFVCDPRSLVRPKC